LLSRKNRIRSPTSSPLCSPTSRGRLFSKKTGTPIANRMKQGFAGPLDTDWIGYKFLRRNRGVSGRFGHVRVGVSLINRGRVLLAADSHASLSAKTVSFRAGLASFRGRFPECPSRSADRWSISISITREGASQTNFRARPMRPQTSFTAHVPRPNCLLPALTLFCFAAGKRYYRFEPQCSVFGFADRSAEISTV